MSQGHVAEVSAESVSSFLDFVLKAPTLEEYRDKKVFIGHGVPFDEDKLSLELLQKGFLENSNLIRCFEITAIPHHREEGLFLISKEGVTDIADNSELLALLTQPNDPLIEKMTDDEIIDYLPTSPHRKSYCFGIDTSDLSYVGLLDREECMQKSQIHPATNPDVGIMKGINTSQVFVGGVNSISEIHLENSLLPSLNVGEGSLRKNTDGGYIILADGKIKIWVMLPEREPIEKVIHAIQAADKASSPAPESLESSLVDDGPLPAEVAAPTSVGDESLELPSPTKSRRKRACKDYILCLFLILSSPFSLYLTLSFLAKRKRRNFGVQKRRSRVKKPRYSVGKTPNETIETFTFADACPDELSRKYLYMTTKFLKRYGIAYETFRQGDHDLVYTMAGVYHQVGQLTANVAEAANYADPGFNVYAGLVTVDRCEKSRLI
ncbi:hypothetical protein QAD02_011329 [Eretmocerus hayati]|uniref:Uncharacterized protein n=1 Tax=Eretmocerus hayati TaxID=131215 RepID=A0ACC2NXF5_9HYME|nr:hypothetical protein QAD02_011329 [Eretmocerus hayati]